MSLNIVGVDQDPDSQPSPQSLLRAAKACSVIARDKSQLLQKIDGLKSIMPVERARGLDYLPFKLLDSIREDAQRLVRDVAAGDQFWSSAGDILIDIVNARSSIGQAVHAVIAAGGDIEITAHNEPGRISLTLVEQSGARKVLLDTRRPAITHQKVA